MKLLKSSLVPGLAGFVLWCCLGCAGPGSFLAPRDPLVRPEASSEYDFLVGRQFELRGDESAALAAYLRAIEKDPESVYLRKKAANLAARLGQYEISLYHAEAALKLSPADPQIRFHLGTLYRFQKNIEKAESVLRAPDGAPINRDAALLLVQFYLDLERKEEALLLVEWTVKEWPGNLSVYLARSTVRESLGQIHEAEAGLREALEFHPGDLTLYSRILNLRQKEGDPDSQIELLEEVLEIYPHHLETMRELASVLVAADRVKEAESVFRKLESFYPDSMESAIDRAIFFYEQAQYEEAARAFQWIVDRKPGQYDFSYFLASSLLEIKEYEQASVYLKAIPESHENYASAQILLAAIQEESKNYTEALKHLQQARKYEKNPSLEIYTAQIMSAAGDIRGGIALLELLAEDDASNDELLFSIGALYSEEGEYDRSLQYMFRALEVNPDNPSVLNYIGYFWAERGENLQEAEEMLRHALEIRPEDGYVTDSLGWVFYMQAKSLLEEGRSEEGREQMLRALETLKKANQLSDGDSVIMEHIGDAYLLLQEKEKALKFYRDAIDHGLREKEQPNLMQKYETLFQEIGEP